MRSLRQFCIEAALPFLTSRLLIVGILLFCSQLELSSVPAKEGAIFHAALQKNADTLLPALEKIARLADARWYLDIAATGYADGPATTSEPKNWVFFPLFPLLIRAVATLVGSPLLAAVVISNISFFAALIVFQHYLLGLGATESERRFALWLICLFPTSYFFSLPHTESLFFLLIIAAFSATHSGRYLTAGTILSLATACRPTGLLLLPAFALALAERRVLFRLPGLLALALAPLGVCSFMLFLWNKTGDPFAFASNQAAWGRGQQTIVELAAKLLPYPEALMRPWDAVVLNALAALAAVVTGIIYFFERRPSWSAVMLVPVIVPLATGTVQSMCRFVMVLFPLYLLAAKLCSSERMAPLLLVLACSLLTGMCAMLAFLVTAAMA
ncbi:MAG: hypothetical protein KDD69_09420 [Bdellovibrionales bacterium]|nr:hypothetical protein [Bdellovibrionales bacterium]